MRLRCVFVSPLCSLRILDFSHNDIEDPAVLDVFAAMENLKVLNLMGNKCIKLIPQYRKTFIIRCKDLTYLDDRPVFPKERAQAEAFFNGFEGFPPGREAEREARQAWVRKEKERQNAGIRHLMQIQARAKAHAKAGTDGGDPDRSDSEEEGDNAAIDNACTAYPEAPRVRRARVPPPQSGLPQILFFCFSQILIFPG